MIALSPATTFSCTVTRVHDGDGPLWCSNGIKVRIAGFQAPDFESASPCRVADPRRVNYRCDNAAAQRSQQIVEHLVLRSVLRCEAIGKSYARVVARCTLPDGRSLSCAVIASGAATRWIATGGSIAWVNAARPIRLLTKAARLEYIRQLDRESAILMRRVTTHSVRWYV